ncbi:MAG: response regulator transcription factor [Ilumatobacteraceae bacterium]
MEGTRVLIVEDEVALGDALQTGFKAEGFHVDIARDGSVGLDKALANTYDVILLDILLPKINGFKVCSSIREAGNWTPILMLTAKHGEYDHAEALDTGADDYLTKPFSFVVLLAHVRALARRSDRLRNAMPLEVGDLVVDPLTRRVTHSGERVELTAREFALLEYLAQHGEQVVTKTDLLDDLWDTTFDGDPNIVEVYIGRLRRKLECSSRKCGIETVRGAGYRLTSDPR